MKIYSVLHCRRRLRDKRDRRISRHKQLNKLKYWWRLEPRPPVLYVAWGPYALSMIAEGGFSLRDRMTYLLWSGNYPPPQGWKPPTLSDDTLKRLKEKDGIPLRVPRGTT